MKNLLIRIRHKLKGVKIWNWVYLKWWNINIWGGTYINGPNSILHSSKTHSITIGKYCSISWWVSIISKNKHNYKKLSTNGRFMKKINVKLKDIWWQVSIEDDVWIGCNSTILPGVKIWKGSIIWAWSVVTKNIPEYCIYAWNPAKFIKKRFSPQHTELVSQVNWNDIDFKEAERINKKLV